LQQYQQQQTVSLEHGDGAFPVLFSPHYIGTTPEICSAGRFDEETGFSGSKLVKKKSFHDHTVTEPSTRRNTGDCLSCFRSETAALDVLNDSNAHCNHHPCNQNRASIAFGCSAMNNTPSARDFAHPGENIEISKVDCSQHGMETVKQHHLLYHFLWLIVELMISLQLIVQE
jgi:hypothetical protein